MLGGSYEYKYGFSVKIEDESQNKLQDDPELVEMRTQLTEMESIYIISVFESIIDMLNILGHTYDTPPTYPDFSYRTLHERFGELYKERPLIDYEACAPLELDTRKAKFQNIQRERSSFEITLIKTIDDLVHHGEYRSLEKFVIQRSLTNVEEEELCAEKKKISVTVANLKLEIEREKGIIEEKRRELEQQLACVKDDLYRVLVKNHLEKQYVKKWESARSTQHTYALQGREDHLKTDLTDIEIALDKEITTHSHIVNFLRDDIERLETEVIKWADKSMDDLENISAATSTTKCELDITKKETNEMRQKFQARQTLLLEREQEKERRRAEEEMQILRNAMARRIQTWWRAILMRRRLRALRRRGKPKVGGSDKKKGK